MNCTALLFRYLSDHIGVTSLFNRKYSIDFLLNLAYNHIHQWHSVRKKTHDLYRGFFLCLRTQKRDSFRYLSDQLSIMIFSFS
jgi:hypothetical protein